MNEILYLPTPERGAESSDDVESTRLKLSVLATFVRCLFDKTFRCTNSCGIDNLVVVFWKFNRRFDRPSIPSPAKLNRYNQLN